MSNNGFDLVLVIPCLAIPEILKDNSNEFGSFTNGFKDEYVNVKLEDGTKKLAAKNYNPGDRLGRYAQIFRDQLKGHSNYELIFDENIKTRRKSLLFGNVIIYEDKKDEGTEEDEIDEDEEISEEEEKKERKKLKPECCYNFFCILSRLTIDKKNRSNDNIFNIVYFVVPDINYDDLTLLMDQSHGLWCNIKGNVDEHIYLTEYLHKEMGYQYFGKIYHIVFSDKKQFDKIEEMENSSKAKKIFNILAAETRKEYSHQLTLSENINKYELILQGDTPREYKSPTEISLTKKERFFDEYNMYTSYRAFASLYTYYYVINENREKDTFSKRISPDEDDEGFSSEANILFIIETELFKVTACLVLSREISEQMYKRDLELEEIRKMFKRFSGTRPLFEKLNYRYLGAQKEADFIYKQFQIGDIITDYDRKRELLRNYSETINSIAANNTSKTLQLVSMVFAAFSGFYALSYFLSDIWLDDTLSKEIKEAKAIGLLISLLVSVIITVIIVLCKKFKPIKKLKAIRDRLSLKKSRVTL